VIKIVCCFEMLIYFTVRISLEKFLNLMFSMLCKNRVVLIFKRFTL